MRPTFRARLRALLQRAGLSADVPVAGVAACGAVLVLVVAAAAWAWLPRGGQGAVFRSQGSPSSTAPVQPDVASPRRLSSAEATTVDPSADSSTCVVHVVGAVRDPGVYELSPGQRVVDAVTAAGGLRTDAAPAGVNLAQQVQDGEQIVVPTEKEVAAGVSPGAGVGGGAASSGAPGRSAGQAGGSGATAHAPVDINTADASALDSLPGVGPATAAKIVADRAANGPFKTVDDLGRVSGIGPKKLEQLKAYVRVR